MTRPSTTAAAPATGDAVPAGTTGVPGRHDRWTPTARQARALATDHARYLGAGWTVDHDVRPRPHFRVVRLVRGPDGRAHRRVDARFPYGGRPPAPIPHRNRRLQGDPRVEPGTRGARGASVPGHPGLLSGEVGEYGDPARRIETGVVRSAIASGRTDENTLTDLVFHRRYPGRNGRPISRGETDFARLSQEWIGIRDLLVRPLLRGSPAAPPPGAPAAPAPSANRRDLLRRLGGLVQAKRIAFLQSNDRAGLAGGTGVVRRSDGADVPVDTQVLRMLVALADRGFTFHVSSVIGGHTKNVSGSGNVSRHWEGHAADFNVINGVDIDTGGAAAKPHTVRFMQALNALRGTDLAPRQVICSGNGRVDPDVLRLQIGVSGVVSGHTNHVHVGY